MSSKKNPSTSCRGELSRRTFLRALKAQIAFASVFLFATRVRAFGYNLGAFWMAKITPVVLSYITTIESNSSSASYTFSGANIGTAAANRLVVVVIHWDTGVTGDSVSNVTIGGNAATIVTQLGATTKVYCAIAALVVPTGSAADIAFNLTGAPGRAAIGIWTVTGLQSTSARAFQGSSGSDTGVSLNLSVMGKGVVVAGLTSDNSCSVSWTSGLTSRYDNTWGSYTERTAADIVNSTGSTVNQAIATSSSGSGSQVMVAATWR